MSEPNTHFLLPSQIFVSQEDFKVNTILGSCVAVCLWDSVNQIGGINHFMLPYWNGNGLATPKYGDIAIDKLLKKMIELGASLNLIKAKIFGGGHVLGKDTFIYNVGERNIELAESKLLEYRIPIIARSTGGNTGRKILFCTQSGLVKQKIIAAKCAVE